MNVEKIGWGTELLALWLLASIITVSWFSITIAVLVFCKQLGLSGVPMVGVEVSMCSLVILVPIGAWFFIGGRMSEKKQC